jgi:hypothetical protein
MDNSPRVVTKMYYKPLTFGHPPEAGRASNVHIA